MKIVCISASNTQNRGHESTSYKVAELIARMADEKTVTPEVEIIPIMNRRIKYCLLCGDCAEEGLCAYDKDFNEIYQKLKAADVCFFIIPHYSPIPSKLLSIFEKINEILYALWLKIPQFESPLKDKPAAVIGHGGMAETHENLHYYHEALITPVANTLKAFGYKVIGLNEEYPMGVPFGLADDSCIQPNEEMVFPEIIQDWELIEERIRPLVQKVLKETETSLLRA